jgi:hypothetical protein
MKFLPKKFSLLAMLAVITLQPVFAAEILNNLRVKENQQKYYYTMFQSIVEPSLWYCGQTKPQVLYRTVDKNEIPEISLIRFQRKDVKNPEKLVEGAHFRMHLSLGPSETAFSTLEKQLTNKSFAKPVKLSPVPFEALKLCFQKPDGEEVELKAESLSGISTRHSSQHVAFSIKLGPLQSDLLDELLRGNTGAKYILYYNYKYADPLITGEAASKNLDGRDSDINRPEQPGSGRALPGSRDTDRVDRKIEQKSGWEKAGQGFIGFAEYNEDVQKQCVFIEQDPERWSNAYLALPLIQSSEGIIVNKIDLNVSLLNNKKRLETKHLIWTPEKGWRDDYGAPLAYAVFDLKKIDQNDFEHLKYSIDQKIISNKNDVLEQSFDYDMLVGDAPISNPLNLADIFEFHVGFLDWSRYESSGLQRIEISLKEGGWRATRTISPVFKNKEFVGPMVHRWLIPKEQGDLSQKLTAEIFFIVNKEGEENKIPWKFNGKNLREELFSLSYIFFDQDWKN